MPLCPAPVFFCGSGFVGGFPRLLKRGGEHADNLLQYSVVRHVLKRVFPGMGIDNERNGSVHIVLDIRQTLGNESRKGHAV